MGKHVYLWSVIKNTFCYEFTIRNLSDFNIISGEDEFIRRPCVSHIYTDKRLEARPRTYNTLLNLQWSRSILPFPKPSVRDSSPSTIGGPFDMSREENYSLVETICLEAPDSMMKLGEIDVTTTKACTLSLFSKFNSPSLFFEQSRREMLFFYRSWVSMSIFFFMQEL